MTKKIFLFFLALGVAAQNTPLFSLDLNVMSKEEREAKRDKEMKEFEKRFEWWPTDAQPGPVKDERRGGYWWWPTEPGKITPWGNRGYVYVYKIIFDYKAEELPPAKPNEPRPSLLVRKTIRNTKIYFDYDKAELREDHVAILDDAVKALKKNPEMDILITGNCDRRGSEAYNLKLGKQRADAVKKYMTGHNIPEERIRIVSRGKLDALAPIRDLVGMQKDRNAHFVIAEVEEVMIPYPAEAKKLGAQEVEEGKYVIEKDEEVESGIEVSTRDYVIKKNDTLEKIAQEELGGSHRWKYLYEFNKDRIKNPDKLEEGTVIKIPVEQEAQKAVIIEEEAEPGIDEEAMTAGSEEPTVSGGTRSYSIKKDDSLWKIAKRELGDGNRWKEIYELNKGKIKNPDKLVAGMKITIPNE
ncbi:MAG: LysM peptidoglycan-binding domain-containing protein [Candidatus Omnitrophica bacterium]|nr:LysM peptidoglycan-binding domain-containing protein [Candidatus Omnitrophota bacterium]